VVQIVISSAGAGSLAEWVLMELHREIEAQYNLLHTAEGYIGLQVPICVLPPAPHWRISSLLSRYVETGNNQWVLFKAIMFSSNV
uniref:Uncharacterized protein n=1 Tax=Sciurus vulgaris TaxID=55149 RepID=A0A8D2B9W7_SCIVU